MLLAGVDIGGTSIKIGWVDTAHGLLGEETFPTPVGNPEAVADLIAAHAMRSGVQALGVGCAGSVRPDSGLVYAGNLQWNGVAFKSILEQKISVPVWVDNDAQAALMAEVYDGACAGVKNAVYLTIGTGIGGALLINGSPWRGHTNAAAELGHMIIHGDGKPCRCSRSGCYEMYASATALSRLAGGLPVKTVFERAQSGDAALQTILHEWIHELGVGMVSLISIFNPEVLVIGGGVSAAGEFFLQAVTQEVQHQLRQRPDFFHGRICLAKHLNHAGVIGAAMLARYHFFAEETV